MLVITRLGKLWLITLRPGRVLCPVELQMGALPTKMVWIGCLWFIEFCWLINVEYLDLWNIVDEYCRNFKQWSYESYGLNIAAWFLCWSNICLDPDIMFLYNILVQQKWTAACPIYKVNSRWVHGFPSLFQIYFL